MRNLMGEELTRENDVEVRWREYFAQVLIGDKMNEVGGAVQRGDWREGESS